MTPAKALVYFTVEALASLRRSWRISLLAVGTIAVSLFIWGAFLLAGENLGRMVAGLRGQARVVVYLQPSAGPDAMDRLAGRADGRAWVEQVEIVSSAVARERLGETFPELEGALTGWDEEPLPAHLEVAVDPAYAGSAELADWVAELEADAAVSMVDDDREWLAYLASLLTLVRGAGVVLGSVLLGAAAFTIAAVVRLTAYMYEEEIATMRLVGATEFVIRAPFYLQGFLQGLAGGLLAVLALSLGHRLLVAQSPEALFRLLPLDRFLDWPALALLVALGSLGGLVGAVFSLRRERLGE